jgi:hypothetical protein
MQLVQQLQKSLQQIGYNDGVGRLMEIAAYRDENGDVIVDSLKNAQSKFQHGEAVFVNKDKLYESIKQLESDPLNHFQSAGKLSNLLEESVNVTGLIPEELAQYANKTEVIALNKNAVEGWMQTLERPAGGKYGAWFDKSQSLWKDAVLALSPRWYLHVTAGHFLQYALGAGPRDILAITKVAGKKGEELRSTIESLFPGIATGLSQEGSAIATSKISALFHFNDQIQTRIRSAMALAMARKVLRNEGEGGELSFRMSQDYLARGLEAIAENPILRDEVLKQALTFVGDYLNFSPAERSVLKRVLPFYSWLRVIGRLTLALPAHHPLMAEAVSVLGAASENAQYPYDFLNPITRRGAIQVGNGINLGTAGFNPFGTVGDISSNVANPGSDPVTNLISALGQSSESPIIQSLIESLTKQNLFTGGQFTAPPGFGGGAAPYGQQPEAINPVTGLPETVTPSRNFLQNLFSNLVPQEPIARALLSIGAPGRPYDTTNDAALAMRDFGLSSTPDAQMFMPPSKTGGSGQVSSLLSPLFSYATGFPIWQSNISQEIKNAMLQNQRMQKGQQQNVKSLAKNAARLRASRGLPTFPGIP